MKNIFYLILAIVFFVIPAAYTRANASPAIETPRYVTQVATTTPVPSVTPTMPSGLDVVRFVFKRREPSHIINWMNDQVQDNTYNDYQIRYEDVNGDGKPEIILTGGKDHIPFKYLSILQYKTERNELNELFHTEVLGWFGAELDVAIKDSRVIVNTADYSGGTENSTAEVKQHWVKCGDAKCDEIFSAIILHAVQDWHCARRVDYALSTIEQQDAATVIATTRRYGMANSYGCVDMFQFQTEPKRINGPTTRETYSWDGSYYRLSNSEQISSEAKITRDFDQESRVAIDYINNLLAQSTGIPPGRVPEVASIDHTTGSMVAGIRGK